MQTLSSSDPARVGRIRILAAIGQGAMGRVLLGRAPDGRLVAVKHIHRRFANDPELRTRFVREVTAQQRMTGAYTAAITDADPDSPRPWMATVFVPGPSLQEAVDRTGPLNLSGLRLLLAGLGSALAEIHRGGLVHRDLKPSNVLLAGDGPRVIDFGIVRAAAGDGGLTVSGAVVGSPAYMSPEQAEGRELTSASDVFSVGAVLAMAASGTSPFTGDSMPQTLFNVVHRPPDTGRVPPALRPLVEACLAKDPANRPTVAQLLEAAGRIEAEPVWPAPIRQQIAQYEAEAAYWSRYDEAPKRDRPRRITWRAVVTVAMVVTLGVLSGMATGTVLPPDTVPGIAAGLTDPAPALNTEELRRIDTCALLDKSVIGELLQAGRPPQHGLGFGNMCTVSAASDAEGNVSSIGVEIGASLFWVAENGEDTGEPVGGMRVLGYTTTQQCVRVAVVPVATDPGIEVSAATTSGDPCPAADAALANIVYRLAVNPPLVEVTPGSVVSLDPCTLVTAGTANSVLGPTVQQPSRSGLYSCLWVSAEQYFSVRLSVDERPEFFLSYRIGEMEAFRPPQGGVVNDNSCALYYPVRRFEGALFETVTVTVDPSDSGEPAYDVLCADAEKILTEVMAKIPAS